ncbi:MAG TPA: hypothetical protein VGO67_06195 [Verrucomicrobiae bacterium]|jgi:hypothetical protein
MELIETLQGQANSIVSVGGGHIPQKTSAKRTPPRDTKQKSRKRKKSNLASRTKLVAIS